MTRVLFWNLNKFGINKVDDPSFNVTPGHGGLQDDEASHMRRGVVARVLDAADADIVIFFEVSSGDSAPNMLATNTGGMEGLIYMLGRLRAADGAAGWRLVPPLRVGTARRSETVGVFYRGNLAGGDELFFTGPNGWVGGWGGASRAPGLGVVFNAYPNVGIGNPDMRDFLKMPGVVTRNVPAGAQHNGGLAEDRLAARVNFLPSPAYPYALTPAGFVDYGPYRQPYMATFTRADGMGAVQRELSIFVVHPPPQGGLPAQYMTFLTYLFDVVAPLGGNETRVIGGDFNQNLLNPATGANAGVYNLLNNPPNYVYQPLLTSPGAPGGVALPAFKGYFATHIREDGNLRVNSRFLWSGGGVNSPYPGYGYIGSNMVADFESIDNILVWPLAGGGAYDTTVMNTITGVPFNRVVPAPGGAPQGGPLPANLVSQMTDPVNWVIPLAGAPIPPAPNAPLTPNVWDRRNLIGWANYGHLRSTSDHFAIVANI
ncbi:MAG: hypothetical protein HZA67_08165 [Rhodospirillales bacterium]|jgi:hypothetical protein|nr:hypothetical protein [Rhodospirillales bacterium]